MSAQTTAPGAHLTQSTYSGPCEALEHAERVAHQLLDVIATNDALFIDAAQVEFLARRSLALIQCAHTVHTDAGW